MGLSGSANSAELPVLVISRPALSGTCGLQFPVEFIKGGPDKVPGRGHVTSDGEGPAAQWVLPAEEAVVSNQVLQINKMKLDPSIFVCTSKTGLKHRSLQMFGRVKKTRDEKQHKGEINKLGRTKWGIWFDQIRTQASYWFKRQCKVTFLPL